MGLYDGITSGTYTAKALAARFGKTKEKQTEFIEVGFEFDHHGETKRISWTGYLTPNTTERTMKTLTEVLGCSGTFEKMDENGNFTDETFLDYSREVKLEIENEEYNGKTYPKVKWVNPMKSSFFRSEPVVGASSTLQKLKADFLAHRKTSPPPPQKMNEEVPF